MTKWYRQEVTFSFATELPTYGAEMPEYQGFSRLTEIKKESARKAFDLWSDVANIRFIEVEHGSISLAASSTLSPLSAGHAYGPGFSAWSGDIWLNSNNFSYSESAAGSYGFYVMLHEIGHALGLKHPGDYNASDGDFSFENDAGGPHDSWQYSAMSYFSETRTEANFNEVRLQTPMIDDIAIIQDIYGANINTRSGDTVYGFNSNTGSEIYDFSRNSTPVLSIWDAGGPDTIDASGFSQDAVIDLNGGAFSSLGGLTNNVSIAHGVLIESAIGGSGYDLLIGNTSGNWLDGGSGNDTAGVSSAASNASIYRLDIGQTIIHSSAGLDQLINIETIAFDDANIPVASLPENSVLEYGASHADLILALGANEDLLLNHLLQHGAAEGRDISFSANAYLNAYDDLVSAFGTDLDAAARHYIEYGYFEGREAEFV